MAHKRAKPAAQQGACGPLGCFSTKISSPENTEAATKVQAARLLRRFGLSPALATRIAELAFGNGRDA